jgi:hypothetical protein
MSKTSRTDARIISLNSANAFLKNNTTFNSDVVFQLIGLVKPESDIKHITFHLVDAQIPVSFYNINYTNNVLKYQISSVNYTITIIPGNYNFTSLANILIAGFLANGHIFTITINKQTGIITFSTPVTNFILQVSSIFTTLGFPASNQISSGFSLTATYPLNLFGITKIKINSTFFNSYNYDSATRGMSNLISAIPVDQPSFGLIIYENKSDAKYSLRTNVVDEIDLQLTDQNDNLINFNNIDWQLTFLLEITREQQEISTTEMSDILKQQNIILNQIANNQNQIQPPPQNQDVEQPINPVITDDLDFFLYSNPNITI